MLLMPRVFKFHAVRGLLLVSGEDTALVAANGLTSFMKKNLRDSVDSRVLLETANTLDQDCVNKLRVELDAMQQALDKDPHNSTLREEEVVYLAAFIDATLDEERFLKQKSQGGVA
nr:hypothetical protein [Tanacetum cinerariifolium]